MQEWLIATVPGILEHKDPAIADKDPITLRVGDNRSEKSWFKTDEFPYTAAPHREVLAAFDSNGDESPFSNQVSAQTFSP